VAIVTYCDRCNDTHDVDETTVRRVSNNLIIWKGDLCFACRQAVQTFILKGVK
jgi:hypothetical protein